MHQFIRKISISHSMLEIKYKIYADTGLMTEFDLPTSLLATVKYLAVAPDLAKVWFTEWQQTGLHFYTRLNCPLV